MLKPLFKGKQRARYDICIYLSQGHYYGIRNLNAFIGICYAFFAANSIEIKVVRDTIVSIVKVLIPKLLLKQLQFFSTIFQPENSHFPVQSKMQTLLHPSLEYTMYSRWY